MDSKIAAGIRLGKMGPMQPWLAKVVSKRALIDFQHPIIISIRRQVIAVSSTSHARLQPTE